MIQYEDLTIQEIDIINSAIERLKASKANWDSTIELNFVMQRVDRKYYSVTKARIIEFLLYNDFAENVGIEIIKLKSPKGKELYKYEGLKSYFDFTRPKIEPNIKDPVQNNKTENKFTWGIWWANNKMILISALIAIGCCILGAYLNKWIK